jgi:translin
MMNNLESIADRARESFDGQTSARDQALSQARTLTRNCANAIRAVHRNEFDTAQDNLNQAERLAKGLTENLQEYPDIYHAGYTQDALKEYAEASIVYALISNGILPSPEELNILYSTYFKGLAEVVGELRRRCLDILRHGHSDEAEKLLEHMDDIYAVLVTMDYPDAITRGLRRLTDIARSIIERTRGDMTISQRQAQLEKSLSRLEAELSSGSSAG